MLRTLPFNQSAKEQIPLMGGTRTAGPDDSVSISLARTRAAALFDSGVCGEEVLLGYIWYVFLRLWVNREKITLR